MSMKDHLLETLNDVLLKRRNNQQPELGYYDTGLPTQKDKPSPKSSVTVVDHYQRLRKVYPSTQGYDVSFIANTNSMEPFLDDSDLVVLEDVRGKWAKRLLQEPLASGQIIIYEAPDGKRIIHTLRQPATFLGQPAWVVQGNNNFLPDPKVSEHAIIARLVAVAYGRRLREGD